MTTTDNPNIPMAPTTKLTAEELTDFLASLFNRRFAECKEVGHNRAVLQQQTDTRHLRPGGTISGPTLMALADAAMYGAILAQLGKVVMAVTTNLSINFLRKPKPGILTAEARILKLGKRLAMGEVYLYCEHDEEPVAHATLTYSIPPAEENDDP